MPKRNHRQPSRSLARLSPEPGAGGNCINWVDLSEAAAIGSSVTPSRKKFSSLAQTDLSMMVEVEVVRWYSSVEYKVGSWGSITILASSQVSNKIH